MSAALVPRPMRGRLYEGERVVRLGDVGPDGQLRLDAVARYLQDLSADDSADAAVPGTSGWVVRRTVLEVRRAARYREPLALATWCSGIGSHYADRRVSITGAEGAAIEAESLWVHLDPERGRPRRVPDAFVATYGEAAGGRRASARLRHSSPAPGAERRSWPVRFSDLDLLGHANNAAYWEAVEEARAMRGPGVPLRAEVVHRRPVDAGSAVELVWELRGVEPGPELAVWLVAADGVAADAVVTALGR